MIWCVDHSAAGAASWNGLARALGGSFTARARGVVSPELILLTEAGEPFGRLSADEGLPGGTRLEAGALEARIEARPGGAYGMTTDAGEVLTAETAGPASLLAVRSGGDAYEARISPLRNGATARSSDGREAARVSGRLAGRRYGIFFDPKDAASLPVAVFLLNHTFALRRAAFRAGS